jgi:hypothetical protein
VSLTWEQLIVDSIAPVDLGRWWCAAPGWIVVNDDPNEFEMRRSTSPSRSSGRRSI